MSSFSMKIMTSLRSSIFLLPFLVAGLVTLSACDSDSGSDSQEIDGEFTLEQLQFTVGSGANALSINVLDTLSTATIDLLGGSEAFSLEYLIEGETGRRVIPGNFSATSDRITLDLDGSSSELNRLLLPREFRLDITENGSVLEGSISRSSVDIGRYNEDLYGDFGAVNGTLQIRFRQAGAAAKAAN